MPVILICHIAHNFVVFCVYLLFKIGWKNKQILEDKTNKGLKSDCIICYPQS